MLTLQQNHIATDLEFFNRIGQQRTFSAAMSFLQSSHLIPELYSVFMSSYCLVAEAVVAYALNDRPTRHRYGRIHTNYIKGI
jgi:hypothetical protein